MKSSCSSHAVALVGQTSSWRGRREEEKEEERGGGESGEGQRKRAGKEERGSERKGGGATRKPCQLVHPPLFSAKTEIQTV